NYNQSQSNKRSIHKAISGNKMLRFYQHSPRMIPEGINPKVHKMFITAEKYEPSNSRTLSKERRSSSLQRKSALFSCVTGQKQTHSHENWSLSPEEFEIWDRLYRIKESDGVKEPILPQIRFETLENLEEISREEEATHELSLSEWSIWQSRPFPTSMVDHSDRCYHFISVMEMIELMRNEQGDCSYDLEIEPHLRMEDVNVQGNKSHLSITNSTFDRKASSSRKDMARRSKVKPFLPDTNDNGSEFSSTFKITKTKTPKGTSGLNLEVPVLPTDNNTSTSYSARRLALVENTDQGSQKDEDLEVTFDLNGFVDLCDNNESAIIHDSSAGIKECKTTEKACQSLGTNHTDSGYSSLTVEKSPVSSDLFYLPESYVDSFALVRPSEELSSLKQTFSHVKRLLSQSPPSWNELSGFEDMMRNEETICPFQKVISGNYSKRLQDKVFSVSSDVDHSGVDHSGVDHSRLLFENPEPKATSELGASVSTCFSKTLSSSETAVAKAKEELHWNDSFDMVFDDEEFTEMQKKSPTINHALGNNPSNKNFVQKDKENLQVNKKDVIIDEEKRVPLFEDGHVYDTNDGSFSVSNQHLVKSDPGERVVSLTEPGFGWPPSEVCCVSAEQTCEEPPASSKSTTLKTSGDADVTEQFLDHEDLYDCSQELFSVNFDLGFSFEECENEIFEEDVNTNNTKKLNCASESHTDVKCTERTSSESEEEIVFQRKNRKKMNVLKSPEVVRDSDSESLVRAVRKRRHPLNTSDVSSEDSADFHKNSSRTPGGSSAARDRNQRRGAKRRKVGSSFAYKNAAREFLDEEAELSQQDADGLSSDESDDAENELNSSLAQFLNDDEEVTQVLNDCEMKGVYLKSVRSPALGNRYKMVHREFNNVAIFSQIPEQDQTYAEDSFCVGEEEEETCQKSESSEEEVCVNFDLLNNESFTSGRKQYLTRRRKKLNQARVEENQSAPVQKKKPSRIIVLSDSSGEETSVSKEKPTKAGGVRAGQDNAPSPKSVPSIPSGQHGAVTGAAGVRQPEERTREVLLSLKASVSETLDFHPEHRVRSTSFPPAVTGSDLGKEDLQAPKEVESSLKNTRRSTSAPSGTAPTKPSSATALFSRDPPEKKLSLCVLVDTHEISSGPEVISSLKAAHGVRVQVCSLSSSDYVVSNRMAVERKFLSELLNSVNRSKVTQRIQRLQSMFERICVIVEKDRIKPGETSRFFQRTQYYDGVLSALVQAGVRVLFSSCQEETAGLLKELAVVEQRKNAAICVPTEVEGHKREMLNFYLSIPNLSYLAALNLCHYFGSVKQMANSSPLEIATGAQVSPQKAEEIYRYLHYGFDVQMLPEHLCAKGRSAAAANS
ncbi:PREDICTED: LOW QUALITY PROTEIN: Fanconi anemia group M protein, partial [Tauraco erythrolophus]|uniref:LOW QUALITY PROTEIN: Fanconi anemia group M protein n=1 Tax=Tauraco erythrolophus TaxID=121530 RepID=UPI0005233D2D